METVSMTGRAVLASHPEPTTSTSTAPIPEDPRFIPRATGTGDKIFHGFFGGFAGAGVGMVGTMLLVGFEHGAGRAFSSAAPLVGAAVGAVIGAAMGVGSAHDETATEERLRFDREIGLHANAAVAEDLIRRFDHDGDGTISLSPPDSGLPADDERVTLETARHVDGRPSYDVISGDFDYRTTVTHSSRMVSAANIWRASDADADRTVTPVEVTGLLDRFDTDDDGRLNAEERVAFGERHPLREEPWR